MIDALFDLLGMCYQDGNLVQAEWIARSIVQAIPDDAVSLQFLGLVYYRTRRRAQAVEAFASADRAKGPSGRIARAEAQSLPRASAQCLLAASSPGSTLAVAWYDLALVLFRVRRYGQALASLRAALAVQPDCSRAQRAMARIARFASRSRLGRKADARAEVPTAVAGSLRH